MKTKKDFPFLSFFISCAVAIVVLIPLRIYQYFNILEQGTGFYEKIDFSVYVLYILMAFVVLFSIAVSFINKGSLKNDNADLSKLTCAGFVLAALGFVGDASTKALNVVDIYSDFVPSYDYSLIDHFSQTGGLIFTFEAVFAIASAVYFFALAAGGFSKKDVSYSLRTLALAPSLWAAMRLLFKFKSTISFTNVSDLLLELFAIVFMMIFFFAFAQTNSKIDKGESYWKLFAYGVPSAVFALTCFVPRMILTLLAHADMLADSHSPEAVDFTVSVMIFIYLISKVTVSQNKKA